MNNKFGESGRYSQAREPFWRGIEEDRILRSPDQEFETSANYREPPDSSVARYNQVGRNTPKSLEPRVSHAGRGPKGYVRTDERIREDVCERLTYSDELDATQVEVTVQDGHVTLDGSVDSREMKRLAEDLAARVPGVTDVTNGLRVGKPVLAELDQQLGRS